MPITPVYFPKFGPEAAFPTGSGCFGPRPKLFCGQPCTLQHRCALHSALSTGHPGSAGGFGQGQHGHGSPFSTVPTQKEPTAFFWGEESGLGHTEKFVSFFTISWQFGPHPCSRQQTLSSVLGEVLDLVQLTSETCCA